MAVIDGLKTWFERDVKFATWAENVRVHETDAGAAEIHLYTDTNEYVLTVTLQDEEEPRVACTVQPRKARAGLSSTRARQLLRGQNRRLSERVWHRVLASIVGMELVRVHRPEPEAAEVSGEPVAEASAEA
jgi:hypothetical protein